MPFSVCTSVSSTDMSLNMIVTICAMGFIGVVVKGANDSFKISYVIGKCLDHSDISEIVNCAAERTLKMIQVIAEHKKFDLLPGVELIRISPTRKGLKKEELFSKNPGNQNETSVKLLVDATARFISGRIIRINLPKSSTESISSAIEEGRGKMKKLNPIMLIVKAIITLIFSLMIGGVSLISAKALVIGKIALVLSLIMMVQIFFTGGTNMLGYNRHGYGTSTSYGVGYPTNYPQGTNSLGGWNIQDKYPYARSLSHTNLMNEKPEVAANQ